MQTEKKLTSIVSYPERGQGGNNRYRGNCSPKLIEDLIRFFKPHEICDYMCGSGTSRDAANAMRIKSHIYDLHNGFDIMNFLKKFNIGMVCIKKTCKNQLTIYVICVIIQNYKIFTKI